MKYLGSKIVNEKTKLLGSLYPDPSAFQGHVKCRTVQLKFLDSTEIIFLYFKYEHAYYINSAERVVRITLYNPLVNEKTLWEK